MHYRNSKHWLQEIRRVIFWLILAAIIGLISQRFFESIAVVALCYLALMIWQLKGIEQWLGHDRVTNPKQTFGFWGDTCQRIFDMQEKQDELRLAVETELGLFIDSFSSLADAVVMLDSEARITWCNVAAQRHLGIVLDKHQGQRLDWHLSHPQFWAFYRNQDKQDKHDTFEMPAPLEAERTLSIQLSHFGVNSRLMFARDITEIRRLEQMRRDFVSNVSHELRTPLTVLTGYIENLSMLAEQVPMLERPLENMNKSAERMELLIKDLLQLAKLETSPHELHQSVVNLRALCKNIVEAASHSEFAQDREVSLDIKHDVDIYGNETQLYSCFMNLLSNACKYSDPGCHIQLRCWLDQSGVSVQVLDDGIGIEHKHIARLTERFYRVDESRSDLRPGTGLGLAIVKHVLALHDGELSIESVPREGSEFTCHFPTFRLATQASAIRDDVAN